MTEKHRVSSTLFVTMMAMAVAMFAFTELFSPSAFAQSGNSGNAETPLSGLLSDGGSSSEVDGTMRRIPLTRGEVQLSFAPLVDRVAPSVVNVYAERRAVRQQSPFAGDPFFERFFGTQRPRRRQSQSSLGSGVIVRAEGFIITNHHVIKDAQEVKIALQDGREFECDIVLKDEQSDLAVLKTRDDVNLPPITIGDSDALKVGDLVLAIGNPFGVGQTVTSGIVSAIARTRRGINDFGFFIQTDAAINPGNSGGALVNMAGELVGINTAIFTRSGGSNGIGFAVPSDMASVVISSAEQGDTVMRPWIGANFQNVTSEIAESLGMSRPRGALVVGVLPDSPAAAAGLRPGDVILELDDNRLEHVDALGYRLATAGIGSTVELTLLSRGKERRIDIALELPPETVPREQLTMPDASPIAGAVLANLSPAVAQEARLPSMKKGVVVLSVPAGSPASANGLRPGDIIRGVNGQKIAKSDDVLALFSDPSRRWQLDIERGGRSFVFTRNGGFFRQFRR